MDFLKRNWSTLILIGFFAAYFGISLGTDQCPMCVVSDLVLGPSDESSASENTAEVVGTKGVPAWTAQNLAGQEVGGMASQGKVCVLVYWATWCAPCIEEIPSLIALREDFPESDVDIIGISLDQPSKKIDTFVTSHGINYDITRNNQSLESAFGPIRYIPTIVILDQEGKIQQRYTGLTSADTLRRQVETLLGESEEKVARL